MFVALERGGGRVEAAGTVRGIACMPAFGPPDGGADRNPPSSAAVVVRRRVDGASGAGFPAPLLEEETTSSSSSIGRNSDVEGRSAESDGEVDAGEPEVQSALKGALDSTDALEEALPMRRGISKFYCGKSKSFTSLADISSPASDLAKPENAYNRKRKNLLAYSINWDRRTCSPLPNPVGSGCTTKKLANSSRKKAAPDGGGPEVERDSLRPRLRPPPYPNNGKEDSSPQRCPFSPRSFSMMDLRGAKASSSASVIPAENLRPGLYQ